MADRQFLNAVTTLIALILLGAALMSASTVFAPLALALLVIAIVWPLQKRLEATLPKMLAVFVSMGVILLAFVLFGWLTIWAFSRVARAVSANAALFQSAYDLLATWLEKHGIMIGSIWSDHFNVAWLLRAVQSLTSRLNSMTSFSVVALVYVLLGLLEVGAFREKIARMENRRASAILIEGSLTTSAKIRRYMLVRTQMSAITGIMVFLLTYAVGLPLSKEWGVIAFVLNYIPFLGPLIATLFPTLYSAAEFQTWQAALALFAGLNLIQFTVGSYLEPRVSGSALAMSPVLVIFSIFLWTFMWGLFGAFIGVPITIAVLTFCALHERTRWLVELLGDLKR